MHDLLPAGYMKATADKYIHSHSLTMNLIRDAHRGERDLIRREQNGSP